MHQQQQFQDFLKRSRGKALSTIWFGLSTAEFILPVYDLFFSYLFMENCLARYCNTNYLFLPFVILNTIKSLI